MLEILARAAMPLATLACAALLARNTLGQILRAHDEAAGRGTPTWVRHVG